MKLKKKKKSLIIGSLTAPNNERSFESIDHGLIWVAISLLSIGLIMVYSSSISIADAGKFSNGNPFFFLIRHSLFIGIGIALGSIAFRIPMRYWQQAAPWLFLIGVVTLIAVLVPGIGKVVNGARRWISLAFINIQPSEFMKFFVMIYAADYTARKAAVMHSVRQGFLPMAFVISLVAVLLLAQPDMGSFVVIVMIAMGILFLGGMSLRIFFVLLLVIGLAFTLMIVFSEYRRQRLIHFMDPWQDELGKGYQLAHALIAFGRGEFWGVGLGGSVEKLFYLPEAHTDFLMAVIAEELGLLGVLIVTGLFATLILKAFKIGRQAIAIDKNFNGMIAQGVGLWLGSQTFFNMGVNTGLLPTKGLTLPLMSFGGSSIVANCLALALLLRVDFENRRLMRGLTS